MIRFAPILLSLALGCAAGKTSDQTGKTGDQTGKKSEQNRNKTAPTQQKTKGSPPERLTRAQAKADTKRLIDLLEQSHPDPYINVGGKVAFKRAAWKLLSSIPKDGIKIEPFNRLLCSFLSQLNDGHTFVGKSRCRAGRGKRADRIPIKFEIVRDGLYISGYNPVQLAGTRGYRVTGVNGVSMAKLIKNLTDRFTVENVYHAYAQLRTMLTDDSLLGRILPGFERKKGITFNLLSPEGRKVNRTIPSTVARGVPEEKWKEVPRRFEGIKPAKETFYFQVLKKHNAAYFRIPTLMGREAYELAYRHKWGNVKKMLARHYRRRGKSMPGDLIKALEGVPSLLEKSELLLREMKRLSLPTLIVDLRRNGGGATPSVYPFFYQLYGDRYHGHTLNVEFVQVHSMLYLKKRHATIEQWRKRTNNPDFTPGDYRFSERRPKNGPTARKNAIAEYKRKGFSFAKKLEAQNGRPIYTPKRVVVLCDADTYSAAFHTAFYLKDLGARVVGVTPKQAPNTFMEVTRFTLPHSRLEGSISNAAQIFLPDDPGARVWRPDFELTYEIARRFGFSQDSALMYALELIRKKKI